MNRELNRLVSDLDTQAQTAFGHRERKIAEAQALSVRLFTITISAAIVLLFLSYLAIHREMKHKDREKKQREKLIGELQESNEANEKLIKFRRNLIQNVTHELRTALAAISGNAELLTIQPTDDYLAGTNEDTGRKDRAESLRIRLFAKIKTLFPAREKHEEIPPK